MTTVDIAQDDPASGGRAGRRKSLGALQPRHGAAMPARDP
jgi:hypothetical protein